MKPIVYLWPHDLESSDFSNLHLQKLLRNWAGAPVSEALSFSLISDPSKLHFLVMFPPSIGRSAKQLGVWAPGLWESDVAELFVCDDSTASYQEFNLSPAGEWWSEHFKADRLGSNLDQRSFTGVEVWFDAVSGYHGLSVDKQSLKVNCEFKSSSRLNVCSILGDEPRCFCSCSDLPGEVPDFHQAAHFEQIELRTI